METARRHHGEHIKRAAAPASCTLVVLRNVLSTTHTHWGSIVWLAAFMSDMVQPQRNVVATTKASHTVVAGVLQIVVLTQRSKLEMEGMFWRCLPESKRFGTKLVFRQGSPLVPSDLRLVGANRAAATIVVSDQSRSAAEADAQSVRCACRAWALVWERALQPGGSFC
jgi:hypothetical protein